MSDSKKKSSLVGKIPQRVRFSPEAETEIYKIKKKTELPFSLVIRGLVDDGLKFRKNTAQQS
jgi:hypothetical protein